jgi:hypothetical protein
VAHADDIKVYKKRWEAVEAFQERERLSTSLELRWRQLNAAYGIAKGLGLLQPDPSEAGVFTRWALLREKAINPHSKE